MRLCSIHGPGQARRVASLSSRKAQRRSPRRTDRPRAARHWQPYREPPILSIVPMRADGASGVGHRSPTRVAREASELSTQFECAQRRSDLRARGVHGTLGPRLAPSYVHACVAGPPAQATNACYGQGSTVWIQGAARPYADLARVGKYTLSSGALRVLR